MGSKGSRAHSFEVRKAACDVFVGADGILVLLCIFQQSHFYNSLLQDDVDTHYACTAKAKLSTWPHGPMNINEIATFAEAGQLPWRERSQPLRAWAVLFGVWSGVCCHISRNVSKKDLSTEGVERRCHFSSSEANLQV